MEEISEKVLRSWCVAAKEIRKIKKKPRGTFETYFIKGETLPLVKIGISENIRKRLQDLQCGSPDKLVILKTVQGDREEEFHKRFAHLRKHGEWFNPDSELLEFLKDM